MINLSREVDLPYILDKFKRIEPVQNVDYSDIPSDMDEKTRLVYQLVIDAIANAKKFAGYEIDNVSDILNNFITQVYSDFAEINSSLDVDDAKENFKDSLDKSIDKLSENLIISNEVEKTQIDKIDLIKSSIEAVKDLVLSLKDSYEKYISSILNGFKDEFDSIEKRFESLIDSKLSKEFSDNKNLNNKIDSAFKNNFYIKKILEKFNAQYLSTLKKAIPSQISIISEKMKREIDAEKEKMRKEKSKSLSVAQLLKKYGLLGGALAIGIVAVKNGGIRLSSSDRFKSDKNYLIDSDFKTINRDFGVVGVATALVAKSLYGLFGRSKSQTAYLSINGKDKKTKVSKPNFAKFEINKKAPIQELASKVYEFSEIVRLNLVSFETDIVESYNARNKLEKAKYQKRKSLSETAKNYGLGGIIFWLLRPAFRMLGKFFRKVRTGFIKGFLKFFKGTRLGKWIEARRVGRLARKLLRRYPGLSPDRALRLAKSARMSASASKLAGKSTAKATSKIGLRGLSKAAGPLGLVINAAFGAYESNNERYMSEIYGIAQDEIDIKHKASFTFASMVAGGTSVYDDPSWYNWVNLGLNMLMWGGLLGPAGFAIGAVLSLIGQERIARFVHENPYTSLGITVGLIATHPAIVMATGGSSLVVGLGIAGIGFLIDRFSKKDAWSTSTKIGENIGLIAGIATGVAVGLKVGALVGTGIGGPIGTVLGGIVGMLAGGLVAAIGFAVGHLIGELFETDEDEEKMVSDIKEKIVNIIQLNTHKYSNHRTLPNVGGTTRNEKESYAFDNLWNGINSLEQINTYMISDARLLLSKSGKPTTENNTVGIAVVPGTSTVPALVSPAVEAAKQEAALKKIKNSGVDPYAGVPLRDRR